MSRYALISSTGNVIATADQPTWLAPSDWDNWVQTGFAEWTDRSGRKIRPTNGDLDTPICGCGYDNCNFDCGYCRP